MLADRISGDLAGIWLLVAEHLRLGTWDLLCGWTGQPGCGVEPRLALQLVHEAAVCTAGIRSGRTLQTRGGFELANGLPFVASDTAIHHLLDSNTVANSQRLQVALGKLRRLAGHFQGDLLAIDPHRMPSHSQRRMRQRKDRSGGKPNKQAQTYWVLDVNTHQPVCFTTATASRSVVSATPGLLEMASEILQPMNRRALILADSEHFSSELIHDLKQRGFELLVPIPNQPAFVSGYRAIEDGDFTRRWAGYATAKLPFEFSYGQPGQYWKLVQRFGETPKDYFYRGFLATDQRDEVEVLTRDYPDRWHIEEFFNAHQALGWKRAGTPNLHIRYGQMTMALIAQAVIHPLRERLGHPYTTWDADHLSRDLFFALDGDVRVEGDTIVVTYYNAPHAARLRPHYEDLPNRLRDSGVAPEVPWLYGYKLDFRFR